MASSTAFGMGTGQAVSYFKWTDARGTVHVSVMPPPGRKATVLKVKEAGDMARSAAPGAQLPEQKSVLSQEVKQAQADYRRQSCQFARNDIARLERDAEVANTRQSGAVAKLDADQRSQARLRAQQRMIQFCSR